jgi:hypothetical protein
MASRRLNLHGVFSGGDRQGRLEVMVKPSSLSMTAVGIAVLIGAAGCTRTSDGSVVLRRPTVFSRLMKFRDPDPVPQYQVQVNEPRSYPPAYAPPAAARARPQRQAKVTAPSLSIVKNAPFKRIDPSKPLSCRNETSSSGRIRVVCS